MMIKHKPRTAQFLVLKRLFPPQRFLLSLLLVILSMVFVDRVLAQDVTPTPGGITDDQVNAIAKQLYCPVCENIPLDVCPTQACAEWRELIRDKLAQGWSEEQIKAYFAEQFGDRVLAVPPARGLNWLVYIVPPVAFLAGVYILYRALRAWRQPAPVLAVTQTEKKPEAAPSTAEDEYVKRLEEELRKR
jgi:cytochrome c-type biogenesis protein CcmH